MSDPTIGFRPAAKSDARRIAELYSIASDGISDYIWSKQTRPGINLLDVGQQRYARRNTPFSYENCTVAICENAVVAVMLAYEMREDHDYVEDDPVLKPYWLLEEPNSYYIGGIAVSEPYRRRGIARRLMAMAEENAKQEELAKLSLIVLEQNRVAHDFYRDLGYKEAMRKAIVPHPLIHYTGDALLLVKRL